MSANPSFCSNELEIVKGSILGNHYKVEAFLGEGGFGIVAKCCDTMTNRAVAIKVNKSDPDILQQAKLEIFILEQLRRLDPDAANIVKWNGFFHDGERVCLKFELLDQCLWEYIGDRKNQGLPISEVRPILGQLTNALSHLGSVGIVHADLKPGNIMPPFPTIPSCPFHISPLHVHHNYIHEPLLRFSSCRAASYSASIVQYSHCPSSSHVQTISALPLYHQTA
uniref:Protein kinase domain-containing protein n=1 Tax=Neolamprologus brichardi TaxID=32507 RepID=A0A3Q4I0D6_NEOBR